MNSPDGRDAGPLATADALALFTGLLDRVDHDERKRLDAASRVRLVEDVVAVTRRVEALRAVLVAEADRAKAAETTRGTSIRTLLTTKAQITQGEAAGWVYSGKELTTHDSVRNAALAGDVSVGQARAIDSVLGELPATLTPHQRAHAEHVLLDKARRLDAKDLAKQTRAVLEEVAPHVDATEDELQRLDTQRTQAIAARAFTFLPNGHGSVLLRGQLPILEATALERLVSAYCESDRHTRAHAHDQLDPATPSRTPEQRRADGLISLIHAHATALSHAGQTQPPGERAAGQEGGPPPSDPTGDGHRTPQLSRLPRLPRLAGDRPRLVVTLCYDLLRDCAEQAGLLTDGTPITAGELRRLLCDADIVPAVLGTQSDILDVGREQRLVTPEIRRALALRDGGCAFPGCKAPEHCCEAHHIVPWWAGGRTSLENLVLLCPHHHGTVEPLRFWNDTTPTRWRVRIADDGHPEFLPPARPDGSSTPVRHPRTHERVNTNNPAHQRQTDQRQPDQRQPDNPASEPRHPGNPTEHCPDPPPRE